MARDGRLQLHDLEKDGTLLAVFVHGLGGEVDSYWGNTRTQLESDQQLKDQGVRFGF